MNLNDILDRVQKADSPDKVLAMDFASAVLDGEWRPYRKNARAQWLFSKDGKVLLYGVEHPMRWLDSIDAIVALIEKELPGAPWGISFDDEGDAEKWWVANVAEGYAEHRGSPALALCAAFLSAKIAEAL